MKKRYELRYKYDKDIFKEFDSLSEAIEMLDDIESFNEKENLCIEKLEIYDNKSKQIIVLD